MQASRTNHSSASVVIVTRNRAALVCEAIESALEQEAVSQIIVIDDASADDTARLVQSTFPEVDFHRNSSKRGYIPCRNYAAQLATATAIISLDDDAVFDAAGTVQHALEDLNCPKTAAVSIPFTNRFPDGRSLPKRQAAKGGISLATEFFVGCSYAVDREVFLRLGGFRSIYIYSGEERDFSVRLLDLGQMVRAGTGGHIEHRPATDRVHKYISHMYARSYILLPFLNAPARYLPTHLAGTSLNRLRLRPNAAHWPSRMSGMFQGYYECLRNVDQRSPVSIAAYVAFRHLQYAGDTSFDELFTPLHQGGSSGSPRR